MQNKLELRFTCHYPDYSSAYTLEADGHLDGSLSKNYTPRLFLKKLVQRCHGKPWGDAPGGYYLTPAFSAFVIQLLLAAAVVGRRMATVVDGEVTFIDMGEFDAINVDGGEVLSAHGDIGGLR